MTRNILTRHCSHWTYKYVPDDLPEIDTFFQSLCPERSMLCRCRTIVTPAVMCLSLQTACARAPPPSWCTLLRCLRFTLWDRTHPCTPRNMWVGQISLYFSGCVVAFLCILFLSKGEFKKNNKKTQIVIFFFLTKVLRSCSAAAFRLLARIQMETRFLLHSLNSH